MFWLQVEIARLWRQAGAPMPPPVLLLLLRWKSRRCGGAAGSATSVRRPLHSHGKGVAAEGINAVPKLSSQRRHCNGRFVPEIIFSYFFIDFREFGLHYQGYLTQWRIKNRFISYATCNTSWTRVFWIYTGGMSGKIPTLLCDNLKTRL